MKDPLERTKVVLRHLPPSLTELALMEQINEKFSGRYKWFCFRSGKNSPKNGRYARAYIDFNSPADVLEFAEFFDGHVFVNEKGSQFKVLVEYAPSQTVPRTWTKKDAREGSISKDPAYLEFLEILAKPIENLPSAEIQLERKETERSGAKDSLIITPLMDFIRQKRAAKSGIQRISNSGKPNRRAVTTGINSNSSSKRGSEKRRGLSLKYVSKDSTKNSSGKESPAYILVPRRNEQLTEKFAKFPSLTIKEEVLYETGSITSGIVSGVPVAVETGKKTFLLLKGKERDNSHVQRLEMPGRIIKSILTNKEGRQSSSSQLDQQLATGSTDKDKRPPRSSFHPNLTESISGSLNIFASDAAEKLRRVDKATSGESLSSIIISDNKHEKRMRNKDRPDRGIWAPLRRSDDFHGQEANFLSSIEMSGGHEHNRFDFPSGNNRGLEPKNLLVGRGHHTSLDNGSHRSGRRGMAHAMKDLDSFASMNEGKPSKRGPNPYEKQVWVQKSGSAS